MKFTSKSTIRRSIPVLAGVACTALALGMARGRAPAADAAEAQAAFEALKALEGTWLLADDAGAATETVASIYHVTAGGSALVETMFPGAEHEMVTVYYVQDDELKMTHYCMLGNRPVLTSSRPTPHEMSFVCSAAECCGDEMHMHAAIIKLVDDTHVTTTWSGNDADEHAAPTVFSLIRKDEPATAR